MLALLPSARRRLHRAGEELTPRPRQRLRLESGLKLDLNLLARRGFIQLSTCKGSGITWSYNGDPIASGFITADMGGPNEGWFRIQIGQLDQRINLVSCPRHFGGRQWYFVCPHSSRRVSVLWKPPGARDFGCRQRWAGQVAYASQFETPMDRTYRGQGKINSRLCLIGGFNPAEWKYPPKPKWMRWRTYNCVIAKFDRYEAILDEGTIALVARLMRRI